MIKNILDKYPYTSQVIGQGGILIIAFEDGNMLGFLWSFRRVIPTLIDEMEDFINVIEVFDGKNRCKGIGSLLVNKCIDIARDNGSYQIRAYCGASDISSHKLWSNNRFAVSPVKMEDGQIVGSYVTYVT